MDNYNVILGANGLYRGGGVGGSNYNTLEVRGDNP